MLSEQLRTDVRFSAARLEILIPTITHRGELVGPSVNGKETLQRMQMIDHVKAWAAILCHQGADRACRMSSNNV